MLLWRLQAFLRGKYRKILAAAVCVGGREGVVVLKSIKTIIINNICSISWIVIGVCQLVNKMEENTGKVKPFNRNDEQFLEAFVIFCGLGIQNTQMYEAVERAMAKQMVTLEVGWLMQDALDLCGHTLSFCPFPCNSLWGLCVISLSPPKNWPETLVPLLTS